MSTEFCYGAFHGGDPRKFWPDPECSTEDERAAHKKACDEFDAADAAGKPLPPIPCPHEYGPNYRIQRQIFGLGTYEIDL